MSLSRRDFLRVSMSAAGGLAVSLAWPHRAAAEQAMAMKLPPAVSEPWELSCASSPMAAS